MTRKRFRLVGFGLLLGVTLAFYAGWHKPLVMAQQPADEALSEPVARGAWLYQGHCVRCHGPYDQERVGSRYRKADDLEAAIEFDGCQLKWGPRYNGPFKSKDIKALADYILAWEKLGHAPDLPELPPQPTPTPRPSPTPADASATLTPTATPDPLSPELHQLLETDAVAQGAWLYTQHCYRCHLSYASNRQALGLSAEAIKRFIEEGKLGTQMNSFSRRLGGPLFGSEIDAIVTYIVTWEALGAEPELPPGLLAAPTPDPALLAEMARMLNNLPVDGDPQRGASLFAQYCTACHGPAGEGVGDVAPSLVKAWPSTPPPELAIKSTILQGVPGTAMNAWGELAGGPLNETELNDLTALVISWSQPATAAVVAAGAIPTGDSTASAHYFYGALGVVVIVGCSIVLVTARAWRNL